MTGMQRSGRSAGFARVLLGSALLLIATTQAGAQDLVAPPVPDVPPLLEVRGAETPVRLQQARVETTIVAGLAETVVDLTFHNPNRRQLEGQLAFPLRDGQRITGFALDFDGQLRAAVPVEKARGQQVFESIERRRVDPALLEQTAGNHFRLRVYPIPAGGTRRVRLRYVEPLGGDADGARLALPLEHAAGAGSLQLQVRVRGRGGKPSGRGVLGELEFRRDRGGWLATLQRAPFHGGGDLSVRLPRADAPQAHVQRFEDEAYFLAEVPVPDEAPAGAPAPRRLPESIGLLWDSSASARRRDRDAELSLLDAYFRAAGDVEVTLLRLRDRTEPAGRFRVRGGDWSALRRALRETVYDGGSNLGDWKAEAGIDEYLMFSDGLGNYGERAFPDPATFAPGQRLYVLHAAGSHADARRLRAWAEATGGSLIAFDAAGVAAAAGELLDERPRLLGLELPGGIDMEPESVFPDAGRFRVAGRLRAASGTLRLSYRDGGGRSRTVELPIDTAEAADEGPIPQLWAGYRIDRLSADPDAHRGQVRRLGLRHGLATAETSLIVLDRVEDYAQHGIEPPAELRTAYQALRAAQARDRRESERRRIDAVATAFAEKIRWWETPWPKDAPAAIAEVAADAVVSGYAAPVPTGLAEAAPVPAPPPAPAAAMERRERRAEAGTSLDRIEVTGSRIVDDELSDAPAGDGEASTRIALQPWEPDSPYARRLREAPADRVYALYLDERDSHAASTAFYLDVADILFGKGETALALRVLSNLAELELENRHVLRVLGYRLLQAGQPALAVPVFEQVLRLAEEEPQSFRDLGLALAAVGRHQDAVDRLHEVVRREWDPRFNGVPLIALAELNAIVARAPQAVDTRRVDPRLLRNLPLDLRAVLSWDSDNSDMDLWVTDPNGEKCFYGYRNTYQGGRLSEDFTGGYGPEEFSLRDARPGRYRVEAHYFGDGQQLVTGATTLQLRLTTGFGTDRAKEELVTLRLEGQSDTVLVGEFEVR